MTECSPHCCVHTGKLSIMEMKLWLPRVIASWPITDLPRQLRSMKGRNAMAWGRTFENMDEDQAAELQAVPCVTANTANGATSRCACIYAAEAGAVAAPPWPAAHSAALGPEDRT